MASIDHPGDLVTEQQKRLNADSLLFEGPAQVFATREFRRRMTHHETQLILVRMLESEFDVSLDEPPQQIRRVLQVRR